MINYSLMDFKVRETLNYPSYHYINTTPKMLPSFNHLLDFFMKSLDKQSLLSTMDTTKEPF